jgi:hypothetical protein
MKKLFIIPIALGALGVPIFLQAQAVPRGSTTNQDSSSPGQSVVEFFAGNPCMVPVYHTNFVFPSEGGAVIRVANGDLYFVPTYVSGCTAALSKGQVIRSSDQPPSQIPPPTQNPPPSEDSSSPGQSVVEFFVGDPCRVPVYHTNFVFPPEGGEIVREGNQLYFVKTYLPGC